MTNDCEIAIVVPVRNRAALVERTLRSIAAQTYRPLRLVLVDNGSTDGTIEMINAWAAEHRSDDFIIDVLQEPRAGACAARNTGLAAVKEPWTMFFDSDDVMAPTHVARAMRCVHEMKKVDIVGWDVRLHTLSGKASTKPFARFDLLFNCVMEGCMATQRYMARTELVRSVGGWREDVQVWNDIELGTRLLTSSPSLVVYKATGAPTVDIYWQTQSITGEDYSTKGIEREHSIDCIEATLAPEQRWIAHLKRSVLAGRYVREGKKEMATQLMKRTDCESRWRRMVYHFAYRYTGIGLPGAAKLLRFLF